MVLAWACVPKLALGNALVAVLALVVAVRRAESLVLVIVVVVVLDALVDVILDVQRLAVVDAKRV